MDERIPYFIGKKKLTEHTEDDGNDPLSKE